ncbi:MAG: efflux RND transporter permease subunit [Bacteroidales bacterium]
MLKTFITRPVLSTVISIIIVLLGVLGYIALPVTQYPDIAPPTIQVRASYQGASAETVLESVIVPLEEQINGVEGMTYMSSDASNDGSATITVYFESDVDPDIAAVNVQNRVSAAQSLLPQAVVQTGVVTRKRQTSSLMFISFYSTDEDYNDVYIQNYLNINILPVLQRIKGVGDVSVFGGKTYAMRVWLDPDKMSIYGVTPADVSTAINEQSQEAAAGILGENNGEVYSYTIKYDGRYRDEEQYRNIILKALGNGEYLRLGDVAKVELDAQTYSSASETNGYPGVTMGIYQIKGSNAQDIIKNIHKELDRLEAQFLDDIKIFIAKDTNEFLDASMDKVYHTLLEAFILVFFVVFIFLQDFRATLIPAIAVPVSIIGTFFFLNLFGYSVNMLTLFALILAIGVVVDDAIVVVEAVYAKIDDGAKDVKKATITAMSEIYSAIITMTLVMVAVYVPITFISGPSGVFYEQFGVTLIISILISAVNALTLSPALCALFLKPKNEELKKKNILQRFYYIFEKGFKALINRYAKSLRFFYRHKWITALLLIGATVGAVYTSKTVPTGFIPNEDMGMILVNIELPPGSSMDRTTKTTRALYDDIIKIPEVEGVSMINGRSMLSGVGSNYGMGFVKLRNWEERKGDDQSIEAVQAKMFAMVANYPDARIIFISPPSVPGFGVSSGVEAKLLDASGGEFTMLDKVNKDFLTALSQRPEIMYAQSSFETKYPQYELSINVPVAKDYGVSISNIFRTLQGYIGGIYSADFSKFGKQYRVYLQSLPADRANPQALERIYVKTGSGEMAPITQFIDLKQIEGPQAVSRYNLFNTTSITAATKEGYSTGDAIAAFQEEAAKLPLNFNIDFSGLTREEIESGKQTLFILILSVLFVYFLLSAQYESYILPLSVLFSLPFGIFGAFFTTKMLGLENNIYFQIALIMLIGLLAKNAILIVEFALMKRKEGLSLVDAAVGGAKERLRPILMTAFSFIFGLLPLVFASGVGARGNRAIGTGAAGGLLIGTLFSIFALPMLFILFQWLQEKLTGAPKPEEEDL